jgi:hypothetical protein
MFTHPTFTGTVSGVSASMVGLGSVTNESKATMFTNPTFTGTVSGVSKAMVGLSNVDNTADASKSVSFATTSTNATNATNATNLSGGTVSATTIGGTTITASTQFSGPGTGLTGTASSLTVGAASTFTSTGQNSQFNSIGIGTGPSGTAGEIRATNNITAYYSDDRLKTRLGPITEALDKVQQLNGFYYEANQTAQDLGYKVRREVGVSAQDVQKILPEIVSPAPIDAKYLTIDYERLVPLLIEAIKELKAEVDELKKK